MGIKLVLLLNFICCFFFAEAQRPDKMPSRTFYIVRHAEKDTGNNPGLLPSGLNRCGDLYRVLKNKKITGIYVTKYRRSQMTADSLSIYSHIPVIEYEADTSGNGLQEKITEQGSRQKNILIIAHSNTIIPIIKKLGVANLQLKSISDEEYDNLFIIHAKKGKVKFIYKKFGDKSALKNDNRKMKPLQ